MSDWRDEIPQRRSKEEDFYNSGPVDPCQELREQLATLKAENERLERENGLLVAVAEISNKLRHYVSTTKDEEPYENFVAVLIDMAKALQAAIDGGALGGE